MTVLLLVSSSLAVGAMAAEAAGAEAHDVAAHASHQHVEAGAHDGLDCHMALCCFALPASEPVEPLRCAIALPRPAAVALLLTRLADPHERPPQQV
ncbi:hypothetical protein NO932_13580 [Pelagibacterium sp. 26DY04]|uniref:hypothetical protein n=1 Tax=Pelagibacterium sp. 26DY04 TaxID=2967130 RepID=UPI0028165E7E|nr:hypothetical protein [Pelagibacterium sp. 26DY04]WMT85949.1 hypothetical protein NO932_13580 [Pelagibacterium sp. 26DY04]